MVKKMTHHDITIIGAGLSGRVAALACATTGYHILLLDKEKTHVIQHQDSRVTALSPSSFNMMKQIGVLKYLDNKPHPILDMRITGRYITSKTLKNTLSFTQNAQEPLGYIVYNHDLLQALHKTVSMTKNIHMRESAKVISVDIQPTHAHIDLADHTEIKTQLVIACDGQNSPLRMSQNIECFTYYYRQTALVTRFKHTKSHHKTAYQLFKQRGPLATLPLHDHESALIWSESSKMASALQNISIEKFSETLTEQLDGLLGDIKIISPIQSFPLKMSLAHQYVKPRFALLGEGAHVIHPLSGQGYNLTLRNAACLADVIEQAKELGLSFSSLTQLKTYEKQARANAFIAASITHSLNTCLSNTSIITRILTPFGIDILKKFPNFSQCAQNYINNGIGEKPRLLKEKGLL